ncbi:hypothetical protein V8J36_13330 [Frigidibacter sp. MR17.14]|uniref:hypothetical protein n=1 Tax=Frigidibacter sp. MR17.14 TaxID=3126509 RepID=UPI003012A343
MQNPARTTVASFHYAGPLYPVFQSLAEILHNDLALRAEEDFAAIWSTDRFVCFTLDGAEIALAYHLRDSADAGGHLASITLGVSSEAAPGDAQSAAPRRGICELLARRIAGDAPAGAEIWIETDALTPETLPALLDSLHGVDPATIAGPGATASPVGRPLSEIVGAARARMATRSAPPPAPEVKTTVANDLPDLPSPQVLKAAQIRDALYLEEEQRPNRVQRVALYSMNITLCAVATPIGVALLTYNALGRENLKVTARVMALTGSAILLAQGLGLQGLSLI